MNVYLFIESSFFLTIREGRNKKIHFGHSRRCLPYYERLKDLLALFFFFLQSGMDTTYSALNFSLIRNVFPSFVHTRSFGSWIIFVSYCSPSPRADERGKQDTQLMSGRLFDHALVREWIDDIRANCRFRRTETKPLVEIALTVCLIRHHRTFWLPQASYPRSKVGRIFIWSFFPLTRRPIYPDRPRNGDSEAR